MSKCSSNRPVPAFMHSLKLIQKLSTEMLLDLVANWQIPASVLFNRTNNETTIKFNNFNCCV